MATHKIVLGCPTSSSSASSSLSPSFSSSSPPSSPFHRRRHSVRPSRHPFSLSFPLPCPSSALSLLSLFILLVCLTATLPTLSNGQISTIYTSSTKHLFSTLKVKGCTSPISKLFTTSVVSAYQVQTTAVETQLFYYATITEMLPLLINEQVDFILSAAVPPVRTRMNYPNLGSYPMVSNAMILAYNLVDVTGNLNLVVDGETLCRIFTGNISSWQDARLKVLNPNIAFPNLNISVISSTSASGALYAFSLYCTKLIPSEWAAAGIAVQRLPIFSVNVSAVASWEEVGSAVLDIPGAVAFMPYPVAVGIGTQISWMKNKAGVIVQPNSPSIAATVIELAVGDVPLLENGFDLTNPSSATGWPVVTMIYLVMNKDSVLSTCANRKALLDWIFFIYTNTVTTELSESINYSMLPPSYVTSSKILQNLRSSIMCNSQAIYDSVGYVASIQGISGSFTSLKLFTNFYYQVSSQYTFRLTSADIDLVVSRILKRETDIAVFDQRLRNDHLVELVDTSTSPMGYALVLPSMLSGVVPIFKLPTVITKLYASGAATNLLPALYPLFIDLETLAALFIGNLNSWLDVRLTKLNPQLNDWFAYTNASTVITKVVCCTNLKDPKIASSMFLIGLNATKTFAGSSIYRNSSVSATINDNILAGDWTNIIRLAKKNYNANFLHLDLESRMTVKTSVLSGVVSFKIIASSQTDITSEFQLLVFKEEAAYNSYLSAPTPIDTSYNVNVNLMTSVAPIPENMKPCVPQNELLKTSFIPNSVLATRRYGACYPLSSIVYFSIPTTYYSSQDTSQSSSSSSSSSGSTSTTNSNGGSTSNGGSSSVTTTTTSSSSSNDGAGVINGNDCDHAAFALKFLSWFFSAEFLATASSNTGLVRVTDDLDIRAAIQDKLNHVVCNDETILITLPVLWSRVSSVVQIVTIIFFAFLQTIFIATLILLYYYRFQPIIRSSSVIFLGLTVLGQMLMVLSLLAWIDTTSDKTCSSFLWLSNLGFTLAFGPLFAKTYRIYAIFSKRKLRVIKISNLKLFIALCSLIVVEITFLSVWQGVSPFKPIIFFENIGGREHQITTCSVDHKGMGFLVTIAVAKFLVLLFGSLMSFSTRQVHSAFNESSQIGWSIYNTVFSALIIAAIQAFVQPREDQHVIIILFLILWINIGLYAFLFIPKWIQIFRTSKVREVNLAAESSRHTTSEGFSFISVESMNSTTLKLYIKSLFHQLEVAKKRLFLLGGTYTDSGLLDKKSGNTIREKEREAESSVLAQTTTGAVGGLTATSPHHGAFNGGTNEPTAVANNTATGSLPAAGLKYRVTNSRLKSLAYDPHTVHQMHQDNLEKDHPSVSRVAPPTTNVVHYHSIHTFRSTNNNNNNNNNNNGSAATTNTNHLVPTLNTNRLSSPSGGSIQLNILSPSEANTAADGGHTRPNSPPFHSQAVGAASTTSTTSSASVIPFHDRRSSYHSTPMTAIPIGGSTSTSPSVSPLTASTTQNNMNGNGNGTATTTATGAATGETPLPLPGTVNYQLIQATSPARQLHFHDTLHVTTTTAATTATATTAAAITSPTAQTRYDDSIQIISTHPSPNALLTTTTPSPKHHLSVDATTFPTSSSTSTMTPMTGHGNSSPNAHLRERGSLSGSLPPQPRLAPQQRESSHPSIISVSHSNSHSTEKDEP